MFSAGSNMNGGIFQTNEANRGKTDQLQKALGGHEITVTPESLPVNFADDAGKRGDHTGAGPCNHSALAERITGIFGKEVVWITTSGKFSNNGVVVPGGLISNMSLSMSMSMSMLHILPISSSGMS